MATLYHRWRTLDSLCATLLQRCKKAAQRHLLCGERRADNAKVVGSTPMRATSILEAITSEFLQENLSFQNAHAYLLALTLDRTFGLFWTDIQLSANGCYPL